MRHAITTLPHQAAWPAAGVDVVVWSWRVELDPHPLEPLAAAITAV